MYSQMQPIIQVLVPGKSNKDSSIKWDLSEKNIVLGNNKDSLLINPYLFPYAFNVITTPQSSHAHSLAKNHSK